MARSRKSILLVGHCISPPTMSTWSNWPQPEEKQTFFSFFWTTGNYFYEIKIPGQLLVASTRDGKYSHYSLYSQYNQYSITVNRVNTVNMVNTINAVNAVDTTNTVNTVNTFNTAITANTVKTTAGK